MQYSLFTDEDFLQPQPFEGRVFCALGTFTQGTRKLQQALQSLGADFKPGTKVSRNVHYVLVGRGAPQDQLEYLQTLNFNGYCPLVLHQAELDDLLQGHYAQYKVPADIRKDLHLTLQHFLQFHPDLTALGNPLYTSELFIAPDTQTPQNQLYQQLGDRGVYANPYIDDTTDILVISDTSLQHLQQGQSDATLQQIEQWYNASRAQTYRLVMISESELLQWLRKS